MKTQFGALCLVSIMSVAWTAVAQPQIDERSASASSRNPRRNELLIGVISPTDGSRQVGLAHEATIQFAFTTTEVTIGGVDLVLDPRNDDGKAQLAAAQAKELVDAGAIAILGPVDSGSTLEVLAQHLEIPVISALSTATSLTSPERDPWFFRMTLNDLDRMREYVKTLRSEKLIDSPSMILYDDSSSYGKGLNENMRQALEIPDIMSVAWSDANISTIGAMNPFPATLFILGASAGSVRHAREIDLDLQNRGGRPGATRYIFVGDDGDLFRDLAPRGSITIGEPTLSDEAGSDIASLRSAYGAANAAKKLKPDTFQVTTYEAYGVLHQALSKLVGSHSHANDLTSRSIQQLRAELRDILEKESFESLEVWRPITLRGGEVKGAPPVSVYQAESGMKVIAESLARPFLEIDAQPKAGYLEGAVTFRVRAHQGALFDGITIERAGKYRVDPSEEREGDVMKLTFYPLLPGIYSLKTGLPKKPKEPNVSVDIGWAYPLAVIGALIGSLLSLLSAPRPSESSWKRVALGVLAGIAVAAIDFHRSFVPGGSALPTLANTKTLAAFWDGLAGGWIGPSLLVLLVGRFIPYPGPQPKPEPSVPRTESVPSTPSVPKAA